MGDINVARTCDQLSAKLEAAYQRNGFLVRLRGGSGIDQHDNQIKSKQLSPPIRRQKRSSFTQDSFHSFIDTKIGYHFSDYKKRINLLIPRFLLSFSLCHTILADLITCTPRDKIHVVNHAGEPLHYYSRIRSFKIPTIPSPITTSLLNKTSLNIIFTQFCILFFTSKQNLFAEHNH